MGLSSQPPFRHNGGNLLDKPLITKDKNPDHPSTSAGNLENDSRWKLAEKVARSSVLNRATQLRDMLLFIVRQTILTPDEPIHESEIAHRVLGRRSDFNPLDDNIVRVQMAHLRKKLEMYFSADGRHESVVITVALGSYKPVFTPRPMSDQARLLAIDRVERHRDGQIESGHTSAPTIPDRSDEAAAEAHPAASRFKGIILPVVAAFLIVALATACIALWLQLRDERRSLESARQSLTPWKNERSVSELWSNFFDTPRDTDVLLSDDSYLLIEQIRKESTPFYSYLNRSYIDQSLTKTGSADVRSIEGMISIKSLGNTSEFKLAHRILNLAPFDRKVHLYSARQYMPALLKQDNVIVIGGRASNPWMALFENRLNFVENLRFEGYGITTVTNRAPANKEQAMYTSSDTVGYCVVAFMPIPGQGGKALLIEGTSAEATEAAGDFLSGEQFSAFRRTLHESKLPYFEILLKTSQVRGTPLTVTVETYRSYPTLQ